MIITRKIVVGVCIVCAVGTSFSQETTTRYRRTTSQGVPEAKLGYTPGVTPE